MVDAVYREIGEQVLGIVPAQAAGSGANAEREANLLVVPLETRPEPKPKLPSRIAWVTDVIPCNLWMVR